MEKQILIKVSESEYKLIKQIQKSFNLTYKDLLLNSFSEKNLNSLKFSEEDKQLYSEIKKDCHDLARLGNALMMKGYDVQLSKDITFIKNKILERLLKDDN